MVFVHVVDAALVLASDMWWSRWWTRWLFVLFAGKMLSRSVHKLEDVHSWTEFQLKPEVTSLR